MNITPEIREQNKQEFLSLVNQIQRDGISDLINFLEKSDFFTAPASIKMYRAEEGGLCAHALARYKVMKNLIAANDWLVENDSFLITSLLADLNKVNYFEPTCGNKKVYSEGGKKMDELGHFDWVSEWGWKVRDPELLQTIFLSKMKNLQQLSLLGYLLKIQHLIMQISTKSMDWLVY